MSGVTKTGRSRQWMAAYEQAIAQAQREPEKAFIRLLARRISAGDTEEIRRRVRDFDGWVAETSLNDLRALEAKLSDQRRGLGRLFKLELSTWFRTRLLGDIRKRIRKVDLGLTDKARGVSRRTSAPKPGPRAKKSKPGKSAAAHQAVAADAWFNIGPFGINYPLDDGPNRVIVPVTGSFESQTDARNAIIGPAEKAIKGIEPNAKLNAQFAPAPDGGHQLSLVFTDTSAFEVMAAMAEVQALYFNEINRTRISEEELAEREAAQAWARLYAKVGNLLNPIPFTEFTEEGFGATSDPSSAITAIKGIKGIRNLKGQGQIKRRTFKPWVKHAGHLKKLKDLFHRGPDRRAWKRAIDNLSPSKKAVLRELQQAEKEVLKLIEAGRRKEAYKIVKSKRKKARSLYNSVRDNYWKEASVRREWKAGGADLQKPAPRVAVAEIQNGQRFRKVMTVTMEHKTRLHDNPFLAVSPENIAFSLSYENSVMLESMRRIAKGRNTVWSNGPIETLVRSIEGGFE